MPIFAENLAENDHFSGASLAAFGKMFDAEHRVLTSSSGRFVRKVSGFETVEFGWASFQWDTWAQD